MPPAARILWLLASRLLLDSEHLIGSWCILTRAHAQPHERVRLRFPALRHQLLSRTPFRPSNRERVVAPPSSFRSGADFLGPSQPRRSVAGGSRVFEANFDTE
ncbi:hypothetical protein GGI42DRAFT_256786 [Trichoderma sp. SZMC 28013]